MNSLSVPRRVRAVALVLSFAASGANVGAAVVPMNSVKWQLIVTPFSCVVLTGQAQCTPFLSLTGAFNLVGSIQGALMGPVAMAVDGESTNDKHQMEVSVAEGELLSFTLAGLYTPTPGPGGVPIPYPTMAYAPGTKPSSDTPREVPPLIGLQPFDAGGFDRLDLSGPLYAFDAPVQVGTWQVILSPASVPEPATLPLVLLACAAAARSRKAAVGPTAGQSG